ncbi:lysophospholipid acyltransferase family protein [Desulfobulbus alkaliphilus]|uniref:lysophospholipid acyltransferase family protein n=1 Tax=Desulfobulbus alkaliphilus TaxID=869814 RepID=UPI0019656032|nr:lysophospholipid acyltransferase family protein [Desulfobulbus alkaliphilus]MBM9538384.1 1-acyl-sn-glycerol-3-phosphate acyltransferase [Desulfobulbus alkaliphilus]
MAPIQTIRGMLTLILAPILTFFVSAIAIFDILFIRRSQVKAQVFARFWGRVLCRLAGVRVKVTGLENIDPDQTYIFAGNHCSQFDIFAFQGYFDHDFRWIAKRELFRVPVFGQAMHRVGYIAIDRSRGRQAMKSLDEAAKRIAGGCSVLIFPEGTRSEDGVVRDFKAGAVLLAIKAGVPIVPIGFNGSYEVLPKGKFLPESGEIDIRIGPPVETGEYRATDKQKLAVDLLAAVEKQLDDRYVQVQPQGQMEEHLR